MPATKSKIEAAGVESNHPQRSDGWFADRLGIPTGSKFHDVLAKTKSGYSASRANYRSELVIERLTGIRADFFSSKAMDWGTDYEDSARLAYELATDNEVIECGFFRHKSLAVGASPDGLIAGGGGVEIKCPNPATHIATLRAQKVPAKYIPQIQGQMWLAGLEWVDFVSFDPRMPRHARIFIQRVARDDDYIANLEAELISFLAEVEDEVKFVENYDGKSPTVAVTHETVLIKSKGAKK
jgi:predicted phage-related endonuclease